MKRIVTLISILAILSGCGRAQVVEIDPEFMPFVDQFMQDSRDNGNPVQVSDLKMHFGPTASPQEAGVCEIKGSETPEVTINKDAWNDMTVEEQKELLYHEMGHCVLKRKHRSDLLKDGSPASIMNPYTMDNYTFVKYEAYYVQELFQGK
jgi:hypothetical protein